LACIDTDRSVDECKRVYERSKRFISTGRTILDGKPKTGYLENNSGGCPGDPMQNSGKSQGG
jgi:hypothetical protein